MATTFQKYCRKAVAQQMEDNKESFVIATPGGFIWLCEGKAVYGDPPKIFLTISIEEAWTELKKARSIVSVYSDIKIYKAGEFLEIFKKIFPYDELDLGRIAARLSTLQVSQQHSLCEEETA